MLFCGACCFETSYFVRPRAGNLFITNLPSLQRTENIPDACNIRHGLVTFVGLGACRIAKRCLSLSKMTCQSTPVPPTRMFILSNGATILPGCSFSEGYKIIAPLVPHLGNPASRQNTLLKKAHARPGHSSDIMVLCIRGEQTTSNKRRQTYHGGVSVESMPHAVIPCICSST